jgi:hypothetical protein
MDINEIIVKLYLEINGFFIRSNIRYYVKDKHEDVGGDSDIDLLAINIKPLPRRQLPFNLKGEDIKSIKRAAIEVKGWHSEAITPSTLTNSPRIFNFLRKEAQSEAKEILNSTDFKNILVISSLGKKKSSRLETISKMQEKGVDHIIEFEEIIKGLDADIDITKNYPSEVLQTLRLVKKYL